MKNERHISLNSIYNAFEDTDFEQQGTVWNTNGRDLSSSSSCLAQSGSWVENFDRKLLDPSRITSEEFVNYVEKYVNQHQCLNCNFLNSINNGYFGDNTVEIVADFLSSYQYFTKNFCYFMKGCLSKMESKEHVKLLLENLDEENGIYDTDDIQMMLDLGLDARALQGISHKKLFVNCIQNLTNAVGKSYSSEADGSKRESVASTMVKAFNAACVDPKFSTPESSIAAMYFGSELLVSKFYKKLIGFLKYDRRLTKQDLAFFILHIDMDVDHAKLMRLVVLDHCQTKSQRENIIKAVKLVLDARVDFYMRFARVHSLKLASQYNKGANKYFPEKRHAIDALNTQISGLQLRCGGAFATNNDPRLHAFSKFQNEDSGTTAFLEKLETKTVGFDTAPGMVNAFGFFLVLLKVFYR